ncbi:hypothetical protein HPP92_003848 [Vanilla planifolia]|uniref:Uncharacterized protein n=1 Tax=Vanilla planifolia TaxID=51239 RepID=A0A835S967_VANPL|nr:hypothetical protein HPP92_003848 [Vanilla planifolia]
MESPSKDHYPVGVFHPNVWGDYFITHASTSSNELSQIQSKIDELKLNLSKMLKETTNHHQSLVLIDTMQHLGVAYHFEIEIDEILNRIHRTGFNPSEDMQTVALGFRLLRQHGLPASPDVFTKFLDEDGDLLNLGSTQSIEDLLGLYEASYFLTPDEKIIEKAAYHARNHLELLADDLNPYMKQMVSRALQIPRLKRVERLEARQFINVYELQQNRIEMLLEFAKLDFQCVQSLHHEELRHLSLWKKEHLRTETKFPFARDRVVESHFWMTGVYFEPCYSSARIFAAKILYLMAILDDIYDQRGTPEELQLFTETINRNHKRS